jgi:hypothetical protein
MVSGDTVPRAGAVRAIPEVSVDETGSVVPQARWIVRRRCFQVAASLADLARKVIFRKVPAASVGRDFVEAAADQAALHP